MECFRTIKYSHLVDLLTNYFEHLLSNTLSEYVLNISVNTAQIKVKISISSTGEQADIDFSTLCNSLFLPNINDYSPLTELTNSTSMDLAYKYCEAAPEYALNIIFSHAYLFV